MDRIRISGTVSATHCNSSGKTIDLEEDLNKRDKDRVLIMVGIDILS